MAEAEVLEESVAEAELEDLVDELVAEESVEELLRLLEVAEELEAQVADEVGPVPT